MSDPGPKPKKRHSIRTLHSADDVRKLLAKLIKSRLAATDTVDNETLRAVTQSLAVLLKATEAADLDDRLQAIEQKLAEHEEKDK